MRRKKNECTKYDCAEPPYLGGLCESHHQEDAQNEARRQSALDVLFKSTVDGRLPENAELKAELIKLQDWWGRVCWVVNHNRKDSALPKDEAEYAISWCQSLAAEIVDTERAYRKSEVPDGSLEFTRAWVWENFDNLEKGLTSNGLKRK